MVLYSESSLFGNLEELFEVDGVLGAFICTNSADLLTAKMPSVFDESMVGSLGEKFSRVLASIKELKVKQDTITVSYEAGTVVLKDLRRGFLAIIISSTEVSPLMEMTFNMVKKKLVRTMTFSKVAAKKTSEEEVEELEEVVTVEETVPAEKIRQLNTELCRYLGPAGGVVIKKKSKKLGFSWNKLPVSMLNKFLSGLEGMIESDKDVDSFKAYNMALFKEYL